jgi:hypothetical protein
MTDLSMFILEIFLGSLSCSSLLMIILIFLLYKENRKVFEFELIAYLCFADFINTISYLIYFIDEDEAVNMPLCNTQAFLMVWFEFSQYIIATLLILHGYHSIDTINLNEAECSKRVKYLVVSFVPAFFFALGGLLGGMFGPSGYWCSCSNEGVNFDIYIIIAHLIMWGIILFNLVLAIKSYRKINSLQAHDQKSLDKNYFKQLLMFPIISLIGIVPATLNRIIYNFTEDKLNYFELVHIVFFFPQGLCYTLCIIYFTNIKLYVKKFLNTLLCCCCCREKKVNKLEKSMFRTLSDKINTSLETDSA